MSGERVERRRAPAYAHIGWCKLLTGTIHEAIPYFEHAIRLGPYGPGIAPWYGRIGRRTAFIRASPAS
jgi:hypothetical protein